MTLEEIEAAGKIMIAAAQPGVVVQSHPRDTTLPWERVEPDNASWDWLRYEYRIKPQMLRYKRYITRPFENSPGTRVYVMHEGQPTPEGLERFVRWIDTEWQEVEL